ncbi:MAG: alpha/beta hydrolase [Pseudomonadota bacterium]
MTDGPTEPGILSFIERYRALAPDAVWDAPAAEQRAVYDRVSAHFRAPRPPKLRVEEMALTLPGRALPLRIYQPPGDVQRPAVVYLHGGGFILGGLESHDDVCAEIAMAADVAVLAVDYRLSPEHPYPAALEDGLAALEYLRRTDQRIDSTRILLAGDSAGGCLAAAMTHALAAGAGPQVQGQILIYPTLGGDRTKGSYIENADAPLCTRTSTDGYWRAYSPAKPDPDDPCFRPLSLDNARDVPATFIVACQHDPLRDDAEAYAEKLRSANVPVTLRLESELVHGYLRARAMSPAAAESFRAICQAIEEMSRAP